MDVVTERARQGAVLQELLRAGVVEEAEAAEDWLARLVGHARALKARATDEGAAELDAAPLLAMKNQMRDLHQCAEALAVRLPG